MAVRAGRFGPLEEREFRLLFLGRVVSNLGSAIAPVGLAFAILRLTGSKSDLGIVLAARQIPQVIFVLVGGVFADRLPRHQVMVGSSLVSGTSQATVAALLLTGHAHVWSLALLSAVNGSSSAFFFPASIGIVPQSVSGGRLQSANALLGLGFNAGGIAGAAIGGLLVAATNPGWALAIDAGSFLLGAVFIGAMSIPPTLRMEVGSVISDLRLGWHEFWARTWLWAVVLQFAIVNAAEVAALNVLGPAQAQRYLGGAAAFGTILAALAAGFLAGGLLSLRFRPQRILLVATLSVFTLALPSLLFALPAATAVIAAGAFLAGVGTETFSVLWTVAIQQNIPQEILSRLTSYDALGSWVLMPVGLVAAGPLSSLIGTRATLFGAAGLIVLATAPVLLVRDIRQLRRRDPREPQVPASLAASKPSSVA